MQSDSVIFDRLGAGIGWLVDQVDGHSLDRNASVVRRRGFHLKSDECTGGGKGGTATSWVKSEPMGPS